MGLASAAVADKDGSFRQMGALGRHSLLASARPYIAVPSDLVYPDKVGETYRFKQNPNHLWFYFPQLKRNEAILLKCYDSKEDARARFTALFCIR
jgi:hypothetical protein